MAALECPNCSASVDVDNRFSHMAVCSSCRSVVTFGEEAAAIRGTLSALPPSRSQLFVGANGSIDGMEFLVLGRVRYGYERGYWDEWYLQRGDGSTSWISEDPASLVLEDLIDPSNQVLSFEHMAPGTPVELQGQTLTVRERDVASCQGGEGQLPFVIIEGEETPFIDLEGPDGRKGSVEFSDDGARIFSGKAIDWSDLKLTATRQDAGLGDLPLAGKAPGGRAQLTLLSGKKRGLNCSGCGGGMEVDVSEGVPTGVTCPYCGHAEAMGRTSIECPSCQTSVSIKSGNEAAVVSCGSCHAQLDVQSSIPAVLSVNAEAGQHRSPIDLGSTFTWDGVAYEVVGWILNRGVDDGEAFFWDELLLFSDLGGSLWLELSDGHASLGTRISDGPALTDPGQADSRITYDGDSFRVAEVGRASIVWVEGELPWVAQQGDEVTYLDAARAPLRLGGEWSTHETEWFMSMYLPRAELLAALSTQPRLPAQTGIPPHKPYPRGATHTALLAFTFAILSLALMAILGATGAKLTKDMTFNKASGTYSKAGAKGQVFEVPEAGEYFVEVSSAKLTDGWAYLRGAFVTEAGEPSAEFTTQLMAYPKVKKSARERRKLSDEFRLTFKQSGKHVLVLRGEARSVFLPKTVGKAAAKRAKASDAVLLTPEIKVTLRQTGTNMAPMGVFFLVCLVLLIFLALHRWSFKARQRSGGD